MKALDSFTVGRLKDLINQYVHEEYNDVSDEEVIKLVSIALAAKRAEPVTWWTGPEPTKTGELESYHDHETGSHYLPLVVSLSAYNTTPQLNSQAGLGSWIKCSDQMPEDDTLCLGVDECGVIWTMHFDDGEFRADTGDVDDLEISHWMPLPAAPEKPL
ncbi:Protein of uncharacterised function (DUF551) [Yersinia enterocolitica]|nr:DUF551 domain-containing protein [Yersinia enterocolitica]CNL30079.1 Protein of uncharacterised function (DUF551) [Yersinia enterocolitica]